MQRLPDSSATKPPFVVAMRNMKGHIVSGHVPLLASSRELTESEREPSAPAVDMILWKYRLRWMP